MNLWTRDQEEVEENVRQKGGRNYVTIKVTLTEAEIMERELICLCGCMVV